MQIDKVLIDDSMPSDKKIHYIEKMIVKELNKSRSKVNMEKVRYYERLVVEIGGEVCTKSEEELSENLLNIKKKAETINKVCTKHITKSNYSPAKRFAIALIAAIILIFSSFSIYAVSVGGYGKAWEVISSSIVDFFNSGKEKDTINGITIIKADYSKEYDSIENLVKNEELNILYPAELPEGIEIKSIRSISYENEKYKIVFVFNKKSISMEVKNQISFADDFIHNNANLKTNNIDIYIISLDEESIEAVFHYNELEYVIISTDKNLLIQLIEKLKGF